MKLFNKVLIGLIALVIVSSCDNNEAEQNVATVEVLSENLIVADYSVEGMVCAMGCAATIQEELTGMNGISSCEVDFETGKTHIEFDKSQLKEKDIIAKIESLADGKYKVSEWNENRKEEQEDIIEGEGSDADDQAINEVSLPSFELPNLFTLLMDQL